MRLFKQYKLYVGVFVLTLFALLIRIPLGTFNEQSSIDAIAHFVLPATGAPLLYVLLRRWKTLPELSRMGAVFFIVLLGVFAEVLWELFEFVVDIIFSLNWQVSNTDTMIDIFSALAGSLVGAIIFVFYYRTSSK